MLIFKSKSETDTQDIAKRLAQEIYPGMNILVSGEMGIGKTCFIKAFLEERGVKSENTSSPTYTFAHYYNVSKKNNFPKQTIVHYDLYRYDNTYEDIGVNEDFLSEDTTTIIEWPEKLEVYKDPCIEVRIHYNNKVDVSVERNIEINFIGFAMPVEKVEKILKEYKIPKHIMDHSEKVTYVAEKVTDHLIEKGYILDKELIRQAAILHDTVRYIDFRSGLNRNTFNFDVDDETWNFWTEMRKNNKGRHHSDVIAEILEKKGYPYIGKIIRAHKGRKICEGFENTSEKVLFYADKRCKHDKIVSLKERLEDIKERYYSKIPEETFWVKNWEKNFELESELIKKELKL